MGWGIILQTFIRHTLPTLEAEYETLAVAMRVTDGEQKSIFSRTGVFDGAEGRVMEVSSSGEPYFDR